MNGATAAVVLGSVVVLAGAGTAAYVMTRPRVQDALSDASGRALVAGGRELGKGLGARLPGVLGGVARDLGRNAVREVGNVARGALEDLGKDLLGSIFR